MGTNQRGPTSPPSALMKLDGTLLFALFGYRVWAAVSLQILGHDIRRNQGCVKDGSHLRRTSDLYLSASSTDGCRGKVAQ
ncbi:hypothetical protein NEOLEDRAFT_1128296 [Neolentinus lepideus HHB14362 ss-1]|uniref:Uncharacterized protein n=1 Tax=Neolentinus lepideus HHB14362 ss-1 TaxID=1314782 RepID=A0A165VDN2_9AGAM|nr:hypothetical protein NEOLEDRAFT_1128296 [Neolentinus lepideus HHB14362 ss-1]